MAALTADRDTVKKDGKNSVYDVAASTVIYKGAIVCLNTSGEAVPMTVSTTLAKAGKAKETVDNSAGAAGDKQVAVEHGIFKYDSGTSGDLIEADDIGKDCFGIDDQTVGLTNGGSTRSKAGVIHGVDTDGGVFVQIDPVS